MLLACEQQRVLGDDGDLVAEIVQANVEHLDAIDDNAARGFSQSEESGQQT